MEPPNFKIRNHIEISYNNRSLLVAQDLIYPEINF